MPPGGAVEQERGTGVHAMPPSGIASTVASIAAAPSVLPSLVGPGPASLDGSVVDASPPPPVVGGLSLLPALEHASATAPSTNGMPQAKERSVARRRIDEL